MTGPNRIDIPRMPRGTPPPTLARAKVDAQHDPIPPGLSIFDKSVSNFGKNGVGDHPGLISLETVKPEKVNWLWYPRIAYGKLTLLEGDPGLGKSTMLLDIAARISTGSPMPFMAEGCKKSCVLLLSAEDGLADTIVPRLLAAGADVSKVKARVIVTDDKGERLPEINKDLAVLRGDIERFQIGLVIIDPIVAYLGSEVNSNKDQDVRRVLSPLGALAEESGAAIVMVRHLNKANGASPMYRGGGSIGFIGAVRSGLLVAKDTDDTTETRRILASQKNNLAAPSASLAYRLITHEDGMAYVAWEGESHHTPTSLLAGPQDMSERPALQEASKFLNDMLGDGAKAVTEIKKEARSAGISDITLRRAKDILGVTAEKISFNPSYWVWGLPNEHLHEDDHNNNEDAHTLGNRARVITYDEPGPDYGGGEDIPF